LDNSNFDKRTLIEHANSKMSISRQCELVGLARSSYYYEPVPESTENLLYMRLMDEQYLKTPFYGVPRMHAYIKSLGYQVNYKRIERLYRQMGLQAIYCRPKTSISNPEHQIYPYLLTNIDISYVNQVWSIDITYIPMQQGFLYLVAIIDWYSRYVVSWRISNSMDVAFCIDCLADALEKGQPEIFNSDQGSQFTCKHFTDVLKDKGIRISMDGKGRAIDNIFIERLWRSVKYEYVYLNTPQTGKDLYDGLEKYFHFYNNERFHQSLEYKAPINLWEQKIK
jgi:putative transposase